MALPGIETDTPAQARSVIRVLIVDDHPLVRMGLRARLSVVPYISVVAEAASGAEALHVLEVHAVDLMLADISMPGMNGIELVQAVHAKYPELHIVVLSMFNNREYIIAAVRSGARGYVLKEACVEETIAAIDAVVAGGTYYSSPAASVVIGQTPGRPVLTNREREVLVLLAHGDSNKAVARKLGISSRTVESHRLTLRRKLGVDSPSELLKIAVMYGWTTL